MGGSSSVVIGYKYYLGMHMVICHGPVDSFQKIIVGEREAWSGNVTSSQQITVSASSLFGGDKKEGGISGAIDIMMGESSQVANDYLTTQLGSPMPAFRGVLSAVLRRVYICAMSAYPKPWSFKVKRIPAKTWYAAKAEINGSANPVHVVYETLTNTDWGMGYPILSIDSASFQAAADKCYSEGLGVSMLLSNQDSIEKFIYDVLAHMNGILYTRPDNGQFAIKLLRDDYTPASLSLYNESNVVTLESFERPSYAEMVNEIVVVYRPQGGTEDDSVTVQDLASVQAQGGVVSQTVQYPGIDNANNAARLAMRDLRQKSTPLSRIRIHVNRNAWNVVIGGVFKFSWAEHGLVEVIYRALGVNYGTLNDGTIIIDAVEDVFGLPTNTYMGSQTSAWVDPIVSPSEFTIKRYEEANYFDVATRRSDADVAAIPSTACFPIAIVGQPANFCHGFEFWSGTASNNHTYASSGVPAPYGTLSANIDYTTTSITFSQISPDFQFTTNLLGTYAYIDDEIVRIDTINFNSKTVVVGRGCLDTVPAKHLAGAILICAEYGPAKDAFEYATGATLHFKSLMRTGTGIMALASAANTSKTMSGRFNKPYAPGNLKVNTQTYPVSATFPVTVTWSHRDRTQQLVRPIIDHTAGNIGPEAGVAYKVRIKFNSAPFAEFDTTGTTYTINNPMKLSLLMHMEGLDNGVLFPEVTGKSVTVVGDTKTKTSVYKVGTSSAYFDGVGDYLTIPAHADFTIGDSVDFTFEAWVYPTSYGHASLGSRFFTLSGNDGTYTGLSLGFVPGGSLGIWSRNSANSANVIGHSFAVIPLNTWTHIAVCRIGSNWGVFIGGTNTWNGSLGASGLLSGSTCYIGHKHPSATETPYQGYLDEVRLVVGTGLYSGNFTPSTTPHPDTMPGSTVTVEVQSIRGTVRSHQALSHTFTAS